MVRAENERIRLEEEAKRLAELQAEEERKRREKEGEEAKQEEDDV